MQDFFAKSLNIFYSKVGDIVDRSDGFQTPDSIKNISQKSWKSYYIYFLSSRVLSSSASNMPHGPYTYVGEQKSDFGLQRGGEHSI